MFNHKYSLLSILMISSFSSAAWEEKFYNPKPLEQDVILPMPCEGNMAFRKVTTEAHNPLGDTPVILGGNSEQDGYAEYATPNYISGSFSAQDKSRYFLMAKYEVTKAQYDAVMTEKCVAPNMAALLPAVNVSWFDAVQFSQKYSEWLFKNAADKLPIEDGVRGFVRLPTNTEWEFASRGGMAVTPAEFRENTFPMKEGLNNYAWFNNAKSANGKLQLIGRLEPNPLGLFDTLGNASEMMFDAFRANKLERYHGQLGGMAVRGGSYLKSEAETNNVIRLEVPFFDQSAVKKSKDMGFRVVIAAPLITSSERIKQLEAEWKSLGKASNDAEKGDKIVDKLEELAKNTSDDKIKQELTKTKDLLRAANLERDEQRDLAVRSALELGTFLCANVSDLDGEVEQNRESVSITIEMEMGEDKEKNAKLRLAESEKARDFVLKNYADAVVSTSAIYNKEMIEAQLDRTAEIIKLRGKSNLPEYLALHWTHLKQYYQNGKIDRANWLKQCSEIKPQ